MAIVISKDRTKQVELIIAETVLELKQGVSLNVSNNDAIVVGFTAAGSTLNLLGFVGTTGAGNAGIRVAAEDVTISMVGDGILKSGEGMVSSIGIDTTGANTDILNSNALLSSSFGIRARGVSTFVFNEGLVEATGNAIDIRDRRGIATVKNEGGITGDEIAILVDGNSVVRNDGAITGGDIGVKLITEAGETSKFTNNGSLSTLTTIAVQCGAGKDTVIQSGSISGKILLGDGNDRLEGVGHFVQFVAGGKGNDVYVVSSFGTISELKNGGTDSVFSDSTALLSDNVENLTLTGTSSINGFGNASNNKITGNNLFNTMNGFGGNDTLTGRGGTDTFQFATGGGRDVITDYVGGTDRLDLSDWTAITSFNDLIDNHASIDGKDVVLQAGSDILRLRNADLADLVEAHILI